MKTYSTPTREHLLRLDHRIYRTRTQPSFQDPSQIYRMPIDPAFAGLFANGVTKMLDTKLGERLCHHVGNGTIKDEETYKEHKRSKEEKRHSSSSSEYSPRQSSSSDRRHSDEPRRRPTAELKRHSSSYYNPEQRGSRRTGSRRKHRRPRRISDAELEDMAEEEEMRRESLAVHEEKMEKFREAKRSYEP